ncbi:CGNR zinc finger domain-containing protein [Rhizobium halophytocola]|uniref:RNA-binding Zn ribbon-like protein n=1 Tax=Rhizobium halophytocola TaxID=735519 RepID=A0ABS4DYG5_9HYPH|nr:CGNR zinc finger domain-containing protein [Rhizobium halophytocola]MBP1850731.1 putative RNA-binding Zn ribbon-like protein [Rhizobium halophytocola]
MSFQWTPHRFSGGALALDVANSVILRADPERCIDRFAVEAQLAAFPQAAARHCAERELAAVLDLPEPAARQRLVDLREAIDAYFRCRTLGTDDRPLLAGLLSAAAICLAGARSETALEAATARSAIRLVSDPASERMKICGNCGWLFLDRSKNRSRTWCDMAVCGNRAKASRHYQRRKQEASS